VSRIPFATAMLVAVTTCVQKYPKMSIFAYVSVIFQLAWLVLWASAYAGFFYVSRSSGVQGITLFFLLVALYWGVQVIKNVVHTSCSGVFATDYFLGGEAQDPVGNSIKRACTTSFGSICFGSLIVALIKAARTIVRMLRQNNEGGIGGAIILCFVDCCLGCLDNLIQYFNHYAYTYVAIYGMKYTDAASATWNLVKTSGIEVIVNDNLIDPVCTLGCFIGGCLNLGIGALLGATMLKGMSMMMAIAGFLLGFCQVMIVMEVVISGVATIMVAWCEDPHPLDRTHPELAQQFRQTYGLNW